MGGPAGSPPEPDRDGCPGADGARQVQRVMERRDRMITVGGAVVAALLTGGGIVVLASVYLWSADPARRRRALQLLKLLLGR
jgi:hypothetical protein